MGKVFFITGIDTDCGKTYITGLLAKHLQEQGVSIITQKLTQTGCEIVSDDIREHRKIMGIELLAEDIAGITCPYVFPFAASPHLSAQMGNTEINPEVLHNATKKLSEKFDIVFVEGVGGLCVPLTKSYLLLDYFKQEKHPLILVSSSKLGSINHTILSLEMCKQNNIPLHAIIYNIFPDTDEQIIASSYEFIVEYAHIHFPHLKVFTNKNLDGFSI